MSDELADTAFLLTAIECASRKHSTQRRKDVHASPYVNHAIAVAHVVTADEVQPCRSANLKRRQGDAWRASALIRSFRSKHVAQTTVAWCHVTPLFNAENDRGEGGRRHRLKCAGQHANEIAQPRIMRNQQGACELVVDVGRHVQELGRAGLVQSSVYTDRFLDARRRFHQFGCVLRASRRRRNDDVWQQRADGGAHELSCPHAVFRQRAIEIRGSRLRAGIGMAQQEKRLHVVCRPSKAT